MSQAAISLDNAGVSYRQYAHPRDALLEWLLRKPRHQDFHALQGISLSLQPGDSLGVVGDNGAGKSTFLKLLAGNLPPSTGQCQVQGRCSALLELGTGLQPEFSGIENARLGLALRGFSQVEIQRLLPEVLAFAELGEFVQQPMKTYSSGMSVRLVFAIAAAVEPEVLIIDEALSVGDQYFQKKSLDRMRQILASGATLVFCSHNLFQVREMCQQAIWLEKGQLRMLGDAQQVVDAYQDAVRGEQVTTLPAQTQESAPSNNSHSPLLQTVVLNQTQFQPHERFITSVTIHPAQQAIEDIHVGIVMRRNDDIQCYGISTLHDGVNLQQAADGLLHVEFIIERLPLLSGEYCLEVWLIDNSGVHVYDSRERCCHFRVQQTGQQQGIGMVHLEHQWRMG